MKRWVPLFKILLRISRWQQSIKPGTGICCTVHIPSKLALNIITWEVVDSFGKAVVTAAVRSWMNSSPWRIMTVGTIIRMKKTRHRKMVGRKRQNETKFWAAARGKLLSLDQQSAPCSTATLSATPRCPISSQSYVQNVKQIGTFTSMEQPGATCTSLESGRAQGLLPHQRRN